ncbi:MAG: hypothetical protein HY912_14725 [Desulfomonile tiedjei]|uniref:Uncharacterized protein n=1 Tax=Desulfomonile tiedjei TaxID=2358 RepID=A0A9D6V3D6_9BACT|nr:hypothetical protein [Desulfomonile tiedjei]
MKANAFTEDSYDGFVVERVRDTSVEARYIEKITYQETVTDPFGNEEIFDRVSYRQVDFNLFEDFPNIELWDAPRSFQAYVSKLLELSSFSLSISPLRVNLLDWAVAFQAELRKQVTIDSMQIAGLELETGVSAKVLVTGDKDVRIALDHFVKGRRYVVEKLQLKAKFDSKLAPIHLTNHGSAKIPEDVLEYLLPLLRNSLPNSVSGG